MKRKISQRLAEWKDSPDRKPLMLLGPRQTGKTTSLLEFGSQKFPRTVHIDFYRQPHLKAAFQGSLEPASVVQALEALLQTDIDPGTTLIIFDEIQDCDEALTSLKFFRSDAPDYFVASAGSLLDVHIARTGSFPVGYVDMLHMHPMDFEEFCWATGDGRAFDMPEAASAFAGGKGLNAVRRLQSDIRTAYMADMGKYASSADATKIISTWESMPAQLAKESGSTKFVWRHIESGAKAERYGTAVDWLVASGIVSRCTQVSEGLAPLKSFENPSSFKLYVADTGLLTCAYQATPLDLENKDAKTARFRGGIAENYVMQQLSAQDVTPYYWGMQSTYEVEFVLALPDGVVPVEVKSGERVSSKSARRFAQKYGCPYVVRVTGKNWLFDAFGG